MVYQMFFTVGNVNENVTIQRKQQQEETDCDCKYDLGCPSGFPNGDCDKSGECKKPEYDCGILGNSQCEGTCDGGSEL